MQAEPRGVLKVNVPVSFGILHVVPALGELMAEYPGLAIDMTLSDREVHLALEGYDVAVSIAGEPRDSLVARKLAPIRRRLCAAPTYLKRRRAPVSLDDLAHHDCIVHSLPGAERAWHFDGDGGAARVEVNGSLRFDNENAIRKAALAGLGIALLPTYIVGDDVRDGHLRLVLPEWEGPRMALFATYLPNRYLAAKVRVFVDHLVAMFGPEPQWDALPRRSAVGIAATAAAPIAATR
jgi:DNA-binding transcriptional LysR family regulator